MSPSGKPRSKRRSDATRGGADAPSRRKSGPNVPKPLAHEPADDDVEDHASRRSARDAGSKAVDEVGEGSDEVVEPEIVDGREGWDLDEAAKATRQVPGSGLADDGDDVNGELEQRFADRLDAAEDDDPPADAELPEDAATHGAEQLLSLPRPDRATALVRRDALGAYLSQIRQYPLLSREEEHELALRYYEHGDREAAYQLITSNLRLVVMIAREYQRAFHNLLDLIQEGNVGLLEAVRNFDPYRGVRLPSYAVWWIRAYIIRYVMNNFRLVKVGTTQAQRRLFFNLQKEKARLEAKGFTPTPKLIARNLGVKEREVVEMDMRMGQSEVSVDAPVHDSDTPVVELMSEADAPTAEEEVANREFYDLMRIKLEQFGETLAGRDLEIFRDRLMAEDPVTLQEIGERWGVSRERVRQIEEALKKKLREFLVAQIRDVPDSL